VWVGFFACGVGLFLVWFFGLFLAVIVVWSVVGLLACCWSFGLSLFSYRSISVAPVRGGTYFSLPAAKKSNRIGSQATASWRMTDCRHSSQRCTGERMQRDR
jgi:hypothetical protein